MTDLMRFKRWLGFYRAEVRLLLWQEQVARLIFSQPRGAGRSFFIRLLAEYDRMDSRSEQRQIDLLSG